MTLEAAVLATLPPVCAIFIERVNPLTEKAVRPKVKLDLARFSLISNYAALEDITTKMVGGAIETAGVAPTVFAVLSSGLGVLFEHPNPWFFLVYIVMLAVLLTLLFSFLGGQTFFQIEATKQPWNFLGKTVTLSRTGSEAIGWFIVRLNIVLILIIWIFYFVSEPPSESIEMIWDLLLDVIS
jgi:hypothetical protein